MNNKLSLTFILTPLLLAVWLSNFAQVARAEWEHIPGTEVIGSVELLESDGVRLYAIGETGFYLSFDDGFTWRRREVGRGIEDFYITAIGSGDGAVYVGTIEHGVFRSDDGGNTWKQINEGLYIFEHPKRGSYHGIVEQLLVTSSGMVINVGYHRGTHISNNRGDLWRDVTTEWKIPQGNRNSDFFLGTGIFSMTEFGGYLWARSIQAPPTPYSGPPTRAPTWELLPDLDSYGSIRDFGRVHDWAELGDKLYIAGIRRLRTLERNRTHMGASQPRTSGRALYEASWRLIAAVSSPRLADGACGYSISGPKRGSPPDCRGFTSPALYPTKSDLYAATKEGIYRASISVVQPYGKALTTWGAVKQK